MSKTIRVPHLGGIDVGYRVAQPIKQSKPTIVFISGITNTVETWAPQLADEELRERLNLVAIDPLGNGQTQARATETWTYWDAAIAVLQAMDALGVRKAFLVGVSSGGWIAARAALYSPDVVLGLVLSATTLGAEGPELVERGCMDCIGHLDRSIQTLSSTDGDHTSEWATSFGKLSLGESGSEDAKKTMADHVNNTYTGDAGRRRLRQIMINMRTRESLYPRLPDIKSPVVWLQGDQDKVYSVQNAEYESKLLTGSPDATVSSVQSGHLVNQLQSKQFNEALQTFTAKYSDKPDARKLREAIGMVDI